MSSLYFGKVSTDNEVRTLLEAYKHVSEGTLLPHKEIAAKVSVDPEGNRYRTIVGRWRRLMLTQFNIELRARHGTGYVALTAAERVTTNIDDGLRIFKRMGQTVERMKVIPRAALDTDDAKRLDHATVLMSRVSDEASRAKKEIAPPAPHRLLVARPVPVSATA